MTKKNRRILFFLLIIIFLVIAPIIILYSFGYRFDFQKKKFTQTGGFYFKVFPKSVQVSVTPLNSNSAPQENKKIIKKTDFLFDAVYLKNLLPQKYLIEIQKDGYYSWEKILVVKEKEVTDAKNITLLPKNLQVNLLEKDIEEIFPLPNEKKFILKIKEPSLNQEEDNWSLKIFDLEKNIKSPLFKKTDISSSKISLADLKFSPDSKKILLTIDFQKERKYYLLDLTKNPYLVTEVNFSEKEIEDVYFHPEDNEKFFIFKNKSLFEKSLKSQEKPLLLAENVIAFEFSDKNIYYLEKSGFLFKDNFSFSYKEKINKDPFPINENLQYKIIIVFDKIFIQDDENLYWLNPETKNFEKFLERIKNYKLSPDFKKISFWSNKEIWIFFLEDDFLSQPQRKKDEKLFITRFSKPINEIYWFNPHYLIFTIEDKIKVSEIDQRDKLNIVDLLEYKEPKIFWIKPLNKLYILSEKNLYSTTIPTP